MVWSRDLFARQNNGGSTVPAICFDPCDDAYEIGQQLGKQSALCAPDSPFTQAIDSCSTCIKTEGSDSEGTRDVSFLLPFLEYCHLVAYSTFMYTSTDGKVATIVYLLPDNAKATTTTSKKTSSVATRSRTSTLATQTSPGPQIVTSSPPVSATPQSHAWIAGPIVGSIAGLAFALGVSLYFWRRRQRRQAKPNDFDPLHDKAQLHSDCIPKPELDAYTNTIHELDAQPAPKRTEMPVNEVPTAELQTRDETESVAVNESDLMRDLGFVIASSTVSDTSTRSNAKAITRKPIQT